jgi:hypothetical protein
VDGVAEIGELSLPDLVGEVPDEKRDLVQQVEGRAEVGLGRMFFGLLSMTVFPLRRRVGARATLDRKEKYTAVAVRSGGGLARTPQEPHRVDKRRDSDDRKDQDERHVTPAVEASIRRERAGELDETTEGGEEQPDRPSEPPHPWGRRHCGFCFRLGFCHVARGRRFGAST